VAPAAQELDLHLLSSGEVEVSMMVLNHLHGLRNEHSPVCPDDFRHASAQQSPLNESALLYPEVSSGRVNQGRFVMAAQ
jgi:hypothetical protein